MEYTAKDLVKQLTEIELLKKHRVEEELIRRSHVLEEIPNRDCGKALRKMFENLCKQ